ncbi:hypothetical protein CRV01_06220 [Arcobacter sp. CECT 8983]|uniref:hypothetical protein n=1 Tax=Arcobacter sp. CECT 8983 TaxID=2044508 RepID=UPI00100A2637|nr:hypothetical protein [Arcobacter sp. CECT 8983]RXJ90742.1 hypothetical protein CRV01_06220 [Arcobacter sp. CECT 8983]
MFKTIAILLDYAIWYSTINDYLYNLLVAPYMHEPFLKQYLLNVLIFSAIGLFIFFKVKKLLDFIAYGILIIIFKFREEK